MNEIKIEILEKLNNLDLINEEIELFLEKLYEIHNDISDYKYLEDTSLIKKINPKRKHIIKFVEDNKIIINKIIQADLLYDFIYTFKNKYNWKNEYKDIFENIKVVGKDKVSKVLNKLKEFGCKTIKFQSIITLPNINYEFVNDDYSEYEYFITDGNKNYLAEYYKNQNPISIKDWNIVINIFSGFKKVYLKTFDIDIDNINFIEDLKVIKESFPNVKDLTNITNYILNLDNIIKSLNSNKELLNELAKNNNEDFYKDSLKDLDILIDNMINKRKNILDKYISIGYEKEFIEENLKYLSYMEWQSHIDYC